MPEDKDYLIVQTDGSHEGWGAVLLCKKDKYLPKNKEEICQYASGKYKEKGNLSSIDAELLAIIYAINKFELFLTGKPGFTVRTDCEAIVKFHSQLQEKKSISRRRWLNFADVVNQKGYTNKIKFEHIKGEDNKIADLLSRILINEGKPLFDTEFGNELINEEYDEEYSEENIIE